MSRNSVIIAVVIAFVVGGFVGYVASRQRAINTIVSEKIRFQRGIDEAMKSNEKLMEENMKLQSSLTPAPSEEVVTTTPAVKKK